MNTARFVPPASSSARAPLRLLQVYAGNRYGGIERFLAALAQSEAEHGMRSRFALCFEGLLARELRDMGAAVDILGDVRFRHPWSVYRARRRLHEILSRERFDAVVSHACWPLALSAPVARERRVPLVYYSHDAPRGEHWVERWAARCSPDLVIANSRFTAGVVARLFPDAPRAVHHPWSVPPAASAGEARGRVRASLGAADTDVAILIAARLEPLKGHLVLADALGLLREVPRWVLWMAGGVSTTEEQAHHERVLARARDAGVAARVHYLGHRGDVPELLAAADIYCQPNTGPETFGLSFVEALYAGRPVITTAIGGALEIVDASTGVLVAPGNAAALAAELARLVRDDSLRSALGAAGPARARALCDHEAGLDRLRADLGRLGDSHA